ncbi:MAG: hypothetical protein ACRCVT_06665 [Leadbetterella sp.]
MRKFTFSIFFVCIAYFSFTQNKKGQFEIAAPLHPFAFAFKSYYLQTEYHNNSTRSTTVVLGYQGTSIFFGITPNITLFQGYRADIGQRWYYRNPKYVRPFVGVNLSVEYSKFKLRKESYVANDSLQTSGLCIGPELNGGIKFVVLKRFTLTPSLGLRYYINTHDFDRITKNSRYWAYDDWFNQNSDWKENRKVLKTFRSGLLPIPYLNLGFVVKL